MTTTGSDLKDLRLRSSVLSYFDVGWLGLEPADEALTTFLLEDAQRVLCPDGVRRWALSEDIRRSMARVGARVLHDAWQAVGKRPDDAVQWALDTLIGRQEHVNLDGIDREKLHAVDLVSRWFESLGDPVPSAAQMEAQIRLDALLQPLRAVTEQFRNREAPLAQLAGQVPGRAIFVHGLGGVGKSALVARHVLARQAAGWRVCYLNFDHSAYDPLQPASLVAALATQLSWQASANAAQWLREIAERTRNLTRSGDSVTKGATRSLSVRTGHWRTSLDEVGAALSPERRDLLVVFDTVEEAQRRDWDLVEVGDLIVAVGVLPGCRVVLSGRADEPSIEAERIALQGLPVGEARALLRELAPGVPDDDLDSVLDLVGTTPLCVRLAAGILIRTGETGAFRDLEVRDGVVAGELYHRLLGHIKDPDVRLLAHPGLTLRRVTADLIRRVLARPCRVEVPDAPRAEELFRLLAREAMLVEREPGGDAVVHRTDVRRVMLARLAADPKMKDRIAAIHRAAIRYYQDRTGPADRTEELYHRLMLEQGKATLDKRWTTEAGVRLTGAIPELPAKARAYLLQKDPALESSFTPEEQQELEVEARVKVLERRVEKLVAQGRAVDALVHLEGARRPDGSTLLPVAHVQVL